MMLCSVMLLLKTRPNWIGFSSTQFLLMLSQHRRWLAGIEITLRQQVVSGLIVLNNSTYKIL